MLLTNFVVDCDCIPKFDCDPVKLPLVLGTPITLYMVEKAFGNVIVTFLSLTLVVPHCNGE